MATPYSIETYLPDKSNIQDTLIQMMHSFDTKGPEIVSSLVTSVYAPKVRLDYDPLLGLEPEVLSSESWARRVEKMHEPFGSTQHFMQNILIDLPQPTTAKKPTQRPDSCKVIASAQVYFYNRSADGAPDVMVARRAGRHQLDLVRVWDLEEKDENPWRVCGQRVRLVWQDVAGK